MFLLNRSAEISQLMQILGSFSIHSSEVKGLMRLFKKTVHEKAKFKIDNFYRHECGHFYWIRCIECVFPLRGLHCILIFRELETAYDLD
jgi:hypothetical protein